mgnify:CR=1 FL=1
MVTCPGKRTSGNYRNHRLAGSETVNRPKMGYPSAGSDSRDSGHGTLRIRTVSRWRVVAIVAGFILLALIVAIDHGDATSGGVRVDPGWSLGSALTGPAR